MILVIVVVLWLIRRLLGSLLGGPKKAGEPEKPQDGPNNMVKDPVCGMYMDSRLAVRIDKHKEAFYFCSEDCKNKYLGKSRKEETGAAPPMHSL
jgi:uncharacterized protein